MTIGRVRRFLVPLVATALMLSGSPPAAASVQARPIVIDGTPVTVTADQLEELTFQWDARTRVILKVVCFELSLGLYAPDGLSFFALGCLNGPPRSIPVDPFMAYDPGTYRITFQAHDGHPDGSMTIELDSALPDKTGTIVVGGDPATIDHDHSVSERMSDWLSFQGTAGQELAAEVRGPFGFTCGGSRFQVRGPDGLLLRWDCPTNRELPQVPRLRVPRLPMTGTYRLEIETDGVAGQRKVLSARVTHWSLPTSCTASPVVPIVLAHGFNGRPSDFAMFRPFLVARVNEELRQAGVSPTDAALCADPYVHAVALGGRDSSAVNARRLQDEYWTVKNLTGKDRIDIIAHSKGGLDSRVFISGFPLVRNLMMIGTPNGGTPIADVLCAAYNTPTIIAPVIRPIARRVIDANLGPCNGPQDALYGITQDFVRNELNPQTLENGAVHRTIAGDSSSLQALALSALMGPNDTRVPVSSVQFLTDRGHTSVGRLDKTHGDESSGLLATTLVVTLAYCQLVGRDQPYPGCQNMLPAETQAVTPRSETVTGLIHYDVADIPAGTSRTITLPTAGAGQVDLTVLADRAGLSGTVGGTPLVADGTRLTARVQSATNVPLVLTNPTAQSASILLLVSGQGVAGLNVQPVPEIVAPGQLMYAVVLDAPGGSSNPTAGLRGAVIAPNGTQTALSFFAFGSAALATFTPPSTGEYKIWVEHAGTGRRLALRRLVVGTGGASLPGTFTESLATNTDGLADTLHLDPTVAVTAAGSYTLTGALTAADGTVIAMATATADLTPGQRQLRLSYPGPVIYAAGKSGPYHLADLTLSRRNSDGTRTVEAQLQTSAGTRAHQLSVFQPPVINPGFVSVTEGNTGSAKVVRFPVTLSHPVNVPVRVNYGSIEPDGWATWPEDYEPILGTLTFLPGETSKSIALTIKGDALDEPEEMALTAFSGATNATIGGFGVAGVTIVDDDGAPVIQPGFATPTAEGNTGTTVVQIPVTLSAASGKTITVRYAPFTQAGWATFPGDFDAPTGTLTFLPGETVKTIPLTLKGDTLDEPDEGALIAFTEPVNATVGGFGVAGVTIIDDD
jgi:hypothetical protein